MKQTDTTITEGETNVAPAAAVENASVKRPRALHRSGTRHLCLEHRVYSHMLLVGWGIRSHADEVHFAAVGCASVFLHRRHDQGVHSEGHYSDPALQAFNDICTIGLFM